MLYTASVKLILRSPSDRKRIINDILSADCVEIVTQPQDRPRYIGAILRAEDRLTILAVVDLLVSDPAVKNTDTDFTQDGSYHCLSV